MFGLKKEKKDQKRNDGAFDDVQWLDTGNGRLKTVTNRFSGEKKTVRRSKKIVKFSGVKEQKMNTPRIHLR